MLLQAKEIRLKGEGEGEKSGGAPREWGSDHVISRVSR
jgi:hypothetical protein